MATADRIARVDAVLGHAATAASRRHLLARAAQVGLLMRHTVTLGVSVIGLAGTLDAAGAGGRGLLVATAVWSAFRLATRSPRAVWLVGDYVFAVSVCLAIPLLAPDPSFYLSNTVPQAIAGTAVVSFSVSVAARVSAALTAGIAVCYAVGAAGVIGWQDLGSVTALFYFAVQWVTASVIRFMLLRLAVAIDSARGDRQEAEVTEQVTMAVRDYEREQLALLHDTAASTLLMVGQDTSVRPDRFAAQARRDLELLRGGAWVTPPQRLDVVAAVRDCAEHLSAPVTLLGPTELWLPGDMALPVIAAAREAITNIERHARASQVCIQVHDSMIRLEDDGVGFDLSEPRTGHGLNRSIIERMHRAGGQARVVSAPGQGTVTELRWAAQQSDAAPAPVARDPDRLVARTRTRYGLAIACYALVNLAITVPPAVASSGHPRVEITLAVLAALSGLVAVPGILAGRWVGTPVAVMLLIAVAIAQPATLPHGLLLGYAHWAQGAVGWCLVPLVLGLATRVGVTILCGTWVAASAVVLARDPSAAAVVNIGLGTASILSVQLFALIFNGLMREAAAAVDTETRAYHSLVKRDRVAQALRGEYQRRYATIVDNVVPLLDTLTRSAEVDAATRRRARAEWRRLRALFDQATVFDHELMRRIRPLIDDAEARHIDVAVDVAGALPEVQPAEIEAATDAVANVLGYAEASARVVIVPGPAAVEISVVVDVAPDAAVDALRIEGATTTVAEAELWCVLRCSTIDAGRVSQS
ncbi:ATP-binding protein [Mycobacterium sp. PSTR-4-N]|uniref:ATP-binding protein n=1 Tax=Mycobacterium sp. PSTR-4-N TaxID=2917745 RepID=UPI001F152DB7|nr:ATP-binding protein [Mycobacterium sp. PSTR-4-N]MCG7592752.1 ATP-binding protein [Mycobacterium sp. PSTR-4-N]